MTGDAHEEAEEPRKQKRVSKACDGCRARKIKCNFVGDNSRCSNCAAVQIACTQVQPRKRRGPASRYVEAQRDALRALPSPLQTLERPPMGHSTPPTEHLVPIDNRFNIEQLAPRSVVQQILDDWFNLIHPVAPILHRDAFLREFQNSSGTVNWEFSALVVSLCAATVSTLRQRAAAYEEIVTVEKCFALISSIDKLKGTLPISLIRCQIKYNTAVSIGQVRGIDSAEAQMLLAEATSMTGRLIHYGADSMGLRDRELCKRLHLLCFAGQCTTGLHARPYIMPSGILSALDSAMPQDLTDAELDFITPGQEAWHGNVTSYVPGLRALSRVFAIWCQSQQGDCNDLYHLQKVADLALSSLDDLPPPLRWRGGLSRPLRSNFGTDVQMVNLYITQIHIRSFLMDQMQSIAVRDHNVSMQAEIAASRQTLIDDMLAIVYQMPEATLEANGHSLIGKLRDIGMSLLEDETNPVQAFANLDRLLAKLDRLDVRRVGLLDSTSPLSAFTSPRRIS